MHCCNDNFSIKLPFIQLSKNHHALACCYSVRLSLVTSIAQAQTASPIPSSSSSSAPIPAVLPFPPMAVLSPSAGYPLMAA
jgi:hypothetical protein